MLSTQKRKIFTVRDWGCIHLGCQTVKKNCYSIIWDLKPLRKSLHLCYSSAVHLFIFCLFLCGAKYYSATRKRTTRNTHCTPDRYNRISNWISPHWNHQIKPCGQQWQEYLTKKKMRERLRLRKNFFDKVQVILSLFSHIFIIHICNCFYWFVSITFLLLIKFHP